jgi:hypothetical protein
VEWASGSSFVKTSENLLNESKIHLGGCFAPYGLGSLWETLKDIKIRKLGNHNSLFKATKFTLIFVNAKL